MAHRNHYGRSNASDEGVAPPAAEDSNDYTGGGGQHGPSSSNNMKGHGNNNKKKTGILSIVKRPLGGGGGNGGVPTTPRTSTSSSSGHYHHQQQQQQQQQQHRQQQVHPGQQQQQQQRHAPVVDHNHHHDGGDVGGDGGYYGGGGYGAPSQHHRNQHQHQQQHRQHQPPPPWGGYNRKTDSAGATRLPPAAPDLGGSVGSAAGLWEGPRRNTYPTRSYYSSSGQHLQLHHSLVRASTADPTLQHQQEFSSSRMNVPQHERGYNMQGGEGGQLHQHQQQAQHYPPQHHHLTRKDLIRNGGGTMSMSMSMPSSHSHIPITLQELSRSSLATTANLSSMYPIRNVSHHHHPSLHHPPNSSSNHALPTSSLCDINTNGRGGKLAPTNTEVMHYVSEAKARTHAFQRRPSKEQQHHHQQHLQHAPREGGGVGGVLPPQAAPPGGVGGIRRRFPSPGEAASSLSSSPTLLGPHRDTDLLQTTTTATAMKNHQFTVPQHPSSSSSNGTNVVTNKDIQLTIVNADVQGWTSFWEVCSSDTMKKAMDIYDSTMRQCYTESGGYEIKAEGGIFHIAFAQPVDALVFALQAQLKLYGADWPEEISLHDDGKMEPALKFHGLRVKFAIHHGNAIRRVHDTTGRIIYSGEAVEIAKAVERMCHGGQILTTIETWNAVCDGGGMAERYLGRPQVVDCGEHLLFKTKSNHAIIQPGGGGGGGGMNNSASTTTITKCTRRIMQLVPNELAFDFFEARGRRDVPSIDGTMGYEIKNSTLVNGRLFPPLNSKRQLTTCFLNAPYANGRVTICFVYTVGLEDSISTNQSTNLGILAKHIRKQLLLIDPPGYECREDDGCWMLAFDTMSLAVTFGLSLKSTILQNDVAATGLVGNVNRAAMFKIGIVSGHFTSMGPHKTTGKADYFGPIVNRAEQVASNCIPGEVAVGIPLSDGATVADSPHFGPTINVKLQGIRKLVGIALDMAIFACSRSSRTIENLL